MVIKHKVEGFEDYKKLIKELEEKKVTIYVLFTGSPKEGGASWCPDCVKAEPAIDEVVSKLPDTIHFVTVLVGDRKYWKDRNCPYRHDKKAPVTTIPTIIKWNCPQRLEGNNFNKKEIIEMAFEDDL